MTLGAIFPSKGRADSFLMSFAYNYGALIFAVPPGKLYSTLEKLFLSLMEGDVCIIILLAVAMVAIFVLKLGSRMRRNWVFGASNDVPFFNMLNMFLGGPVNRSPARTFARNLFLLWLWSSFALRNVYQGHLVDHLTSDQRKSPLDRLDKLYASNQKLFIYDYFYDDVAHAVSNQTHR